jgi:hypothetical protein
MALAFAAALAALAFRPAAAGACLLDNRNDTCPDPFGRHHSKHDVPQEQERAPANAPPLLTKEELVAGFAAANPGVWACGRAAKRHGAVVVDLVIGRDGKMTSAIVRGALERTALGICVEKTIRASISFRPSGGVTVAYAFALDPPPGAERAPTPAAAPADDRAQSAKLPSAPPAPPSPPPAPPPPPAIEW